MVIVARDGATALTIDAVAKEAGMSKGGVLHHYPKKEVLLRAVVESMIDAWDAAVDAHYQNDPVPVGRYVRAFLHAMTEPALTEVGRGLLGAIALDSALIDPLRASYDRCQKRIAHDGLEPLVAYQAVLVAEAMWFRAIFELPPPPKKVLAELRKRLLAATRSSATRG